MHGSVVVVGGEGKEGRFRQFPLSFYFKLFLLFFLLPVGRNCMRESSQLSLASSSLRLVSSQFLFPLSLAVDIGPRKTNFRLKVGDFAENEKVPPWGGK